MSLVALGHGEAAHRESSVAGAGAVAVFDDEPLAHTVSKSISVSAVLVADAAPASGASPRRYLFKFSSAFAVGSLAWVAADAASASPEDNAIDCLTAVRELDSQPPPHDLPAAIVIARIHEFKRTSVVVTAFVALVPGVGLARVPNARRNETFKVFVRAMERAMDRTKGEVFPRIDVGEGVHLELFATCWYPSRAGGSDPTGSGRAAAMQSAFASPALQLATADADTSATAGARAAADATAVAAATVPAAEVDDTASAAAPSTAADAVLTLMVEGTRDALVDPAAPETVAAAPALSTVPVPDWLYLTVNASERTGGFGAVRLETRKFPFSGLDVAWVYGRPPADGTVNEDLIRFCQSGATSDAPVNGPMLIVARFTDATRTVFAAIADSSLRLIQRRTQNDAPWADAYSTSSTRKVRFEVKTSSWTVALGTFLHLPQRGPGHRSAELTLISVRQACLGLARADAERVLSLTNPRRLGNVLINGGSVATAVSGRFDAFTATSAFGGEVRLSGRTLGEALTGQPRYAGRVVWLPPADEQAAYTTQPGSSATSIFPETTTLRGVLQWITGLLPVVPSGSVAWLELPDVSNIRKIPIAWVRRALEFQCSRCKLVPECIPVVHATTVSFDTDQFGFVARNASVLPSLMRDAYSRGAQFLCDMHTNYSGETRRVLPDALKRHWERAAFHRSCPQDDAAHWKQIAELCAGEFQSGPVKDIFDDAESPRNVDTLIYAMGLFLLVLGGAGPSCKSADVHSQLSMSSATSVWEAKAVDFCGPERPPLSSLNSGNASGAQPFKISVKTVPPPRSAEPVPDTAHDANLKTALKWMFAITPLMTQAGPSAQVSFRLRLAEAFDSSRSWHQVYHPVAVIAALLLYMLAPGATDFRHLSIACWTYGNKLHGQILASVAELRALVDGSDADAASAATAVATRLRQALGDDSPIALVCALRNMLHSERVTASHGLGMAHTAAGAAGRPVIAWPRVLGAMRAFPADFRVAVDPVDLVGSAASDSAPVAPVAPAAAAKTVEEGEVGRAARPSRAAGNSTVYIGDAASDSNSSTNGTAPVAPAAATVEEGGEVGGAAQPADNCTADVGNAEGAETEAGASRSEQSPWTLAPNTATWRRRPVGRQLGGCYPVTFVPPSFYYSTSDRFDEPTGGLATWARRDALLADRDFSGVRVYSTGGLPTWASSMTLHVSASARRSAPIPPVVHRSEHYVVSHNAIAATGTRGGGDLTSQFGDLGYNGRPELSKMLQCITPFMNETDNARIAMGRKPVLRSEVATAVDASLALDWRIDDIAQQIYHLGRTLRFDDTRAIAAVDAADAAAFGQLMAAGLILALSGSATVIGQLNSCFPDHRTNAFFANACRQMKHFYNPFRLDPYLVSEGEALGRMVLGPLPPSVEAMLGPVEAAREPLVGLTPQMRTFLGDRRGPLRGEWIIAAADPADAVNGQPLVEALPSGPAHPTAVAADPDNGPSNAREPAVPSGIPSATTEGQAQSAGELLTRAINVTNAVVVGPGGTSTKPFGNVHARMLAMRPGLLGQCEVDVGLIGPLAEP